MKNFKPNLLSSLFGNFVNKTMIVLAFCFILQHSIAQTYTIGGVNYTACSGTETVVAPFNSVFGATTAGQYSGMVLLTVSGTGASLGSVPGDAFYIFIPGSPSHDFNHYQLVTTIEGTVHHSTGSNDDAYRHIVYDVDAGTAVTPPYTPPYHANNTYTFIINMNTLIPSNPNPTNLRVGVNDGNYGDNFCSGCTNNYTVQVTQLCAPPPCDDTDGDGICDEDDNCPETANANQADADDDGTGDVCDGCPNDGDKTEPGQCGCGVADTDTDGDGTADCNDGCPNDSEKTEPGICGCGVADTDSDGDGTADCNDGCPNDAGKTEPGQCGCGNPDTDNDGDGVANCNDNCVNSANANQSDADCDGVGDACDVCPGGDDSIDNNNDGLPDCKYPPAYNQIIADWKCGNNKVYICHHPPGNPSNTQTLCVSYNAIGAHIAHGDYLGTCGNANCGGAPRIAPNGNSGTDEFAVYQGLEMFPNPARNEVNFHLHGFDAVATDLTIFDYSGKLVWQKTLEEGLHAFTLDLSGSTFASGIYFVKVSSEGNVLTERLVITK